MITSPAEFMLAPVPPCLCAPSALSVVGRPRRRRPTRHRSTPAAPAVRCRALPPALAIIASGAAELAHAVATVAAQLLLSEPLVVAICGLAEHAASWQSAFRAAVLQRVPGARITEPRLSPVQGAALLALQHSGVQLNADAL